MAEYVIRCTPADPEWPSYIVDDGSGEYVYYPTAGMAHSDACDMQERTRANVTYSVEER